MKNRNPKSPFVLFPIIVLLLLLDYGSKGIAQKGTTYTSPPKDEIYTQKRKAAGVSMVQVDAHHQVWTQKIGSGNIPLLLLHGGPGATHEYFENFPQYLDTSVFTIYFYDQLGSFFSDTPTTDTWQIDRFVEEVESVRKALYLEKFYLLGHSWGGLLALEYANKHQSHLKALLISNTPFTKQGASKYRKILWKNTWDELKVNLGRQPTNQEVKHRYERIYRYGLDTIPIVVQRSEEHYNRHPERTKMFSHAKYWPALEEKVSGLNIPVLIIGGEKDFIDPRDFELMHKYISDSELVIIPNAPHFPMWSNPNSYFQAIEEFINRVE